MQHRVSMTFLEVIGEKELIDEGTKSLYHLVRQADFHLSPTNTIRGLGKV